MLEGREGVNGEESAKDMLYFHLIFLFLFSFPLPSHSFINRKYISNLK